MDRKSKEQKSAKSDQSREDRLKASLKANMAKRKAQAKARKQASSGQGE